MFSGGGQNEKKTGRRMNISWPTGPPRLRRKLKRTSIFHNLVLCAAAHTCTAGRYVAGSWCTPRPGSARTLNWLPAGDAGKDAWMCPLMHAHVHARPRGPAPGRRDHCPDPPPSFRLIQGAESGLIPDVEASPGMYAKLMENHTESRLIQADSGLVQKCIRPESA